jgi:hypothetical protein
VRRMRNLRLLFSLATLRTENSPVHLPGRGEGKGHGRCPRHPSEYLVKERDGYFCLKGDHPVSKEDRLLP